MLRLSDFALTLPDLLSGVLDCSIDPLLISARFGFEALFSAALTARRFFEQDEQAPANF
jgi:hypothetical protein